MASCSTLEQFISDFSNMAPGKKAIKHLMSGHITPTTVQRGGGKAVDMRVCSLPGGTTKLSAAVTPLVAYLASHGQQGDAVALALTTSFFELAKYVKSKAQRDISRAQPVKQLGRILQHHAEFIEGMSYTVCNPSAALVTKILGQLTDASFDGTLVIQWTVGSEWHPNGAMDTGKGYRGDRDDRDDRETKYIARFHFKKDGSATFSGDILTEHWEFIETEDDGEWKGGFIPVGFVPNNVRMHGHVPVQKLKDNLIKTCQMLLDKGIIKR